MTSAKDQRFGGGGGQCGTNGERSVVHVLMKQVRVVSAGRCDGRELSVEEEVGWDVGGGGLN